MTYTQYEFKEYLLEFVLISYFEKNNKYSLRNIINFDLIEPAVKDFINHFYSYDLVHKTSHTAIIEQMFVTKELSRQNCDQLGYSKRTFYRYRRQYLRIFEIYLFRNIEFI